MRVELKAQERQPDGEMFENIHLVLEAAHSTAQVIRVRKPHSPIFGKELRVKYRVWPARDEDDASRKERSRNVASFRSSDFSPRKRHFVAQRSIARVVGLIVQL